MCSSLARKKSICHEGREVRDEVLGHNGHFRHFHPRFRSLKGGVKRAEQEGLDVVQGGHSEFGLALPRRNSGQHVIEELVQQSLAGPLLREEWLRAVIFQFDAVLCWSFLKWNRFPASTCYVSGHIASYIACKHSPFCAGDQAQKGVRAAHLIEVLILEHAMGYHGRRHCFLFLCR